MSDFDIEVMETDKDPSWSVIEYSTTMASDDFSRQALLRFFRKNNHLKRP